MSEANRISSLPVFAALITIALVFLYFRASIGAIDYNLITRALDNFYLIFMMGLGAFLYIGTSIMSGLVVSALLEHFKLGQKNKNEHGILNPKNIPQYLWPLIPYAEWVITNSASYEDLLAAMSKEATQEFVDTLSNENYAKLSDWLAICEKNGHIHSKEYEAFNRLWDVYTIAERRLNRWETLDQDKNNRLIL